MSFEIYNKLYKYFFFTHTQGTSPKLGVLPTNDPIFGSAANGVYAAIFLSVKNYVD